MRAVAPSPPAWRSLAAGASLAVKPEPPVAFSDDERAAILAHGPWPPAFTRDPKQPRLRQPRRHRARQAAVLGHAPLGRRQALVRDVPRPRPLLSPTAATAASGSPASTATPSRSPTCGSTAGSAGPAPPTACGRRASARSSTRRSSERRAELVRERLAADAGDRRGLRARVRLRARRRMRPSWSLVNVAKALAAFQETIATGPHAVRRFPRCARDAATGRPWPAIRPRRSEA